MSVFSSTGHPHKMFKITSLLSNIIEAMVLYQQSRTSDSWSTECRAYADQTYILVGAFYL